MQVDSIGLTVSDMDRSVVFYTQILSFKIINETRASGKEYEKLMGVSGIRARIVRLRLGREEIELIEVQEPQGRPIPDDSKSNDHWFQHIAIIVSDMDKAFAQLQKHEVTFASIAPQTLPDWNPAAGGIKAFYFKDPDGNNLEILQFPPGKGEERWQQNEGQLFLGIDHTAIVVADTKAALEYYCEGLGLTLKGQSENYGVEQARLNNVEGARLLITSVGGGRGPAIEFLEYLKPQTGRAIPERSRVNDLWYWQINLRASSSDEIKVPGDGSSTDARLLHDPTGHALLVFSSSEKCNY